MENNCIHILCTRPVNENIIGQAAAKNILIEVLPFIETEPVRTIAIQQQIEQVSTQSTTVVFTSMNAVEAVAAYVQNKKPNWQVYCMGHTTQQLIKKYFENTPIVGTAGNATELAELIAEQSVSTKLVFFCGDQRRDELPTILHQHGIEVQEIEVYHTIATPHELHKTYQGILFFSPTAVHSFFSVNTILNETILFAIGSTTANAIQQYSLNTIITANISSKESLVMQAIDFFTE